MISDELLKEVEASRRAVKRDVAAFKYQMDLPARTKDSIRAHRAPWLGGAAFCGFLLAIISPRLRRSKRLKQGQDRPIVASEIPRDTVKSVTWVGVLYGIFKTLLPLARPALTAFAAKRFAEMASKL